MADFEVDFTLEEQPTIEADFAIELSNNDHTLLVNRDVADQHPMSAITGLETALEGKQDVISDLSDIRSGAASGATSLQPGDLTGYQTTSNLVTSVSSLSTDAQYPSAKLFYDTCGDIETAINTIRGV